MNDGIRLAEAASRLIGTPFRLHGRDPMVGLDCIGLVASSLEAMGRRPVAPQAYRLRNSDVEPLLSFAELSGLEPARGNLAPGEILLTSPGPGQHHLMIVESALTAIHAHAGLGRVVRQPIESEPNLLMHWRLSGSAKEE